MVGRLMSFGIKRSKADALFSNYIRELAGYSCERCHKEFEKPAQGLHNSHFHSRAKKSVRFDPENCASLCFSCHNYFSGNPNDHVEFFKKRLGLKRFQALAVRAATPQKVDEAEIALALELMLQKMKSEKKVLK